MANQPKPREVSLFRPPVSWRLRLKKVGVPAGVRGEWAKAGERAGDGDF